MQNNPAQNAPHEANFLKLDCSKLKSTFNWKPKWHIQEAIEKVCEWSHAYIEGGDCNSVMEQQIKEFFE